jgi:hypothetical protein
VPLGRSAGTSSRRATRGTGLVRTGKPSGPIPALHNIDTLGHARDEDPRWHELRERRRREYETDVSADDPVRSHATRWYSKHGVQTAVVAHLIASGWSLQWVGDCLKRDRTHPSDLGFIGEPFHDVEAERDAVRLLVEIVGHPGSLDGPRDGQAQVRSGYPTQRSPFAFPRYSDALFTGPALRGQYPDARIVQAFPTKGLYRTYAPGAYGSTHVRRYAVELWLVNEDGKVEEQAEGDY